MKYLADENVPLGVVKELRKLGIPIESVTLVMRGASDTSVLEYARKHQLIIITFDKDFGQLIFKNKLKSYGLLLLRFLPKSYELIMRILSKLLLRKELDPSDKIVVVHENHIRVVNLPNT